MGKETGIAWTDRTFNPAWGCDEQSAGCDHCYAREFAKKTGFDGRDAEHPNLWGSEAEGGDRRTFSEKHWQQPIIWNRLAEEKGQSERVFCASMMDICDPHPKIVALLPRLWDTIRRTPWLDWQLLTKIPARYRKHMLPSDWGNGWGNVWLGTTVEATNVAWRIKHLKENPALVYWLSYEPALDDLTAAPELDLLSGMERVWIIYGGESGSGTKNFRPEDPAWKRNMRTRCAHEGWAFFHKQSSAVRTEMGILIDGEVVRDYPMPRRTSPAVLPPAPLVTLF